MHPEVGLQVDVVSYFDNGDAVIKVKAVAICIFN